MGDPRRPQDVKNFERGDVNIDDSSSVFGFLFVALAVILGTVSLMFKHKFAGYGACVCVASAIVRAPHETSDHKLTVMATVFAVMGLIASYMTPM